MRRRLPLVALSIFWIGIAQAGPVIPPGREALLLSMLTGDLPDSCKLENASVDRTFVTARYTCASSAGPIVVELHHPSDAKEGDTLTTEFAITSSSPALAVAVAQHVREREGQWSWKVRGERSERSRVLPIVAPPHRGLWLAFVMMTPLFAMGMRRWIQRARKSSTI